MPHRQLTPEMLPEIRDLAAGWGKIVARRAFGDQGPGLDVDFDMMEQIARAAAAGLAEGTLATARGQPSQALGDTQPCPAWGTPCHVRHQPRELVTPGASVSHSEPVCHCPACRRDFSPQRTPLRLDNHAYSPAALRLIVLLAARLGSFADTAFAWTQTGLPLSAQHVCTWAQQVGAELVEQRDRKADQNRSQVPVRVAATPEVVAVEIDGGRLRTRATGAGPGVHEAQHKEDKIACLVTLRSEASTQDPQPEPPPSFLQPRRVERLVQQMAGQAGEGPAPAVTEDQPPGEQGRQPAGRCSPEDEPWAPRKRVSTCVASLANSRAFGRMVAAEAKERDFYRARRKAFVADGAAYNWKLQQRYFAGLVPIADFLHVLCYVYRAAWAVAADEAGRWQQDVAWLSACWQGRVGEVIQQLRDWQGRIGRPPPEEELAAKDPRRAVAEALRYFGHNEQRMTYPQYRREGLPVTSSLVESLVGEVNARVKGKQKYWNRDAGAEAMLQRRAAVLSEDERRDRYRAARPGSPYRRREKKS